MPARTTTRAGALLLSVVAVITMGTAPAATQELSPPLPPPPSLAVATAGLSSLQMLARVEFQPAAVRLPRCEVGDVRTRFGKVKQWRRTLLDTNLKLRRSYRPWDLVSVSRAGIAGSGNVRKIMVKDLRALAQAARRAGKPLAVRSAYRSYEYQDALFASYTRTFGYAKALTFSARAGHSEHQLGTTIDFSVGPGVPLSARFGESPSGKWLARNGWKYGFIMSYPKGKRWASCYSHEPWHWRYFGRELARRIHESGEVPRRYLYEHFETAP